MGKKDDKDMREFMNKQMKQTEEMAKKINKKKAKETQKSRK